MSDEGKVREMENKYPDFELLKMSIIKKAWEDESFKRELIENPKEALGRHFQLDIPEDLELKVLEEDQNMSYLIIPRDDRCWPIPPGWKPRVELNKKYEVMKEKIINNGPKVIRDNIKSKRVRDVVVDKNIKINESKIKKDMKIDNKDIKKF